MLKRIIRLTCRIQIGSWSYTFAWRLYLRQKTVRRLNPRRPKEQRLPFKSKYRLAREMLEVLIAACQEAIQTGAIETILQRFIAWPLAA